MRRRLFRCGLCFCVAVAGCAPASIAQLEPGTSSMAADTSPLIEFRLVHDAPAPGRMQVEYAGEVVYLDAQPIISDADLREVHPEVLTRGLLVNMRLTPEGARRMARVTAENIGGRMALLLESRVVDMPVIRSPVGSTADVPALAVVGLPDSEAERVAQRISRRWPSPGNGGRR